MGRTLKVLVTISKFVYLWRIAYSEQKPPQLCHTVGGVKFTGHFTISYMRIFFEVDINSEFGANFNVCSYTVQERVFKLIKMSLFYPKS